MLKNTRTISISDSRASIRSGRFECSVERRDERVRMGSAEDQRRPDLEDVAVHALDSDEHAVLAHRVGDQPLRGAFADAGGPEALRRQA